MPLRDLIAVSLLACAVKAMIGLDVAPKTHAGRIVPCRESHPFQASDIHKNHVEIFYISSQQACRHSPPPHLVAESFQHADSNLSIDRAVLGQQDSTVRFWESSSATQGMMTKEVCPGLVQMRNMP